VLIFCGVGAVAGVGLASIWPFADTAGLTFEVGKACIQVMGVALIGGLASVAAAEFQRERIERFETAQADAERRHEAQTRHDDFVRSLLTQTIDAYHDVKRVRRLLQALAGPEGSPHPIPAVSYREAIGTLNDAQLTFESLKRISPLTKIDGLKQCYRHIEKHLNEVLDESKGAVARAEDVRPSEGSALNSLLFDTADFRANVSSQLREVVKKLQTELLAPNIDSTS
jgi:hypothetical protein